VRKREKTYISKGLSRKGEKQKMDELGTGCPKSFFNGTHFTVSQRMEYNKNINILALIL
jgi:hypothetical protein